MAAPKPKYKKALELMRDNPEMTMAEAARKARLKDTSNVFRFLSRKYGGVASWREAGCPV